MTTIETPLEQEIRAFLIRKYATHADERQKAMGLSYVTAEVHDLSRQIARLFEYMNA